MTISNCLNSSIFKNLKWVNFIVPNYTSIMLGGSLVSNSCSFVGDLSFLSSYFKPFLSFIVGILQFYNHVISKLFFFLNSYLVYLVLPVSVDLCQFWNILRHNHVAHFPISLYSIWNSTQMHV